MCGGALARGEEPLRFLLLASGGRGSRVRGRKWCCRANTQTQKANRPFAVRAGAPIPKEFPRSTLARPLSPLSALSLSPSLLPLFSLALPLRSPSLSAPYARRFVSSVCSLSPSLARSLSLPSPSLCSLYSLSLCSLCALWLSLFLSPALPRSLLPLLSLRCLLCLPPFPPLSFFVWSAPRPGDCDWGSIYTFVK